MSTLPTMPLEIALIGAGNVGTGVAALLAERGQRIVGVASRSRDSASRAARLLSTEVFQMDSPVSADMYLIGTGPAAFESVVTGLVARLDLSDRVLVHFSGAHGVAPMATACATGAHVLALHPVQACPSIEAAIHNLPGSTWGVTTSEGAEDWADDLVRCLDGRPVRVQEVDRVIWHSAAVVTSNGIAALSAAGEQILHSIGVDNPEAVLAPLAAGTLNNARVGGGGARTLTGPVVRKEFDVVRNHVATLDATDVELGDIYRIAAELIAHVAVTSGRLDADLIGELKTALERRP